VDYHQRSHLIHGSSIRSVNDNFSYFVLAKFVSISDLRSSNTRLLLAFLIQVLFCLLLLLYLFDYLILFYSHLFINELISSSKLRNYISLFELLGIQQFVRWMKQGADLKRNPQFFPMTSGMCEGFQSFFFMIFFSADLNRYHQSQYIF
jgi:hypothetical protein